MDTYCVNTLQCKCVLVRCLRIWVLCFTVIEVCSGEYGDYADKMVAEVDNGRSTNYCKKRIKYEDAPQAGSSQLSAITYAPTTTEIRSELHSYESPTWMQFKILLFRMWLQMWRDRVREKRDLLCSFLMWFQKIFN